MDQHLQQVVSWLDEAASGVRILQHLAWPASARRTFFDRGAAALPEVTYPPFDDAFVRDRLGRARHLLATPETPVEHWLARQADAIDTASAMLAAAGTPGFLEHSRRLFGTPRTAEGERSPASALAHEIASCERVFGADGEPASEATRDYSAEEMAQRLRRAISEAFGAHGPDVVVVDDLSANVLAGPRTVRVRARARFNERDVAQLIEHEILVHVLTTLNGQAQPQLPLLGRPHGGTTHTQEGLAVFAEHITGRLTFERLQRLADRVLAIEMALDGADFVEVYRFFDRRCGSDPGEAFDNTQRVFRGGRVSGGVAFTKDIVYLDGLVRVHRFLEDLVAQGRLDLLPVLFMGKLDLADVAALAELAEAGHAQLPALRAPWAADTGLLASQLTYSRYGRAGSTEGLRPGDRHALETAPRVG